MCKIVYLYFMHAKLETSIKIARTHFLGRWLELLNMGEASHRPGAPKVGLGLCQQQEMCQNSLIPGCTITCRRYFASGHFLSARWVGTGSEPKAGDPGTCHPACPGCKEAAIGKLAAAEFKLIYNDDVRITCGKSLLSRRSFGPCWCSPCLPCVGSDLPRPFD
jgi:hypothetical protein